MGYVGFETNISRMKKTTSKIQETAFNRFTGNVLIIYFRKRYLKNKWPLHFRFVNENQQ